jgi:hypothetical protein
MKRYSILALFFLFLLPLPHANGLATNVNYIATPPNFGEMSYDDANTAINEIVDSVVATKIKSVGPNFVIGLVDQLRRGGLDDEKKVLVIYLLGCLRPKDTNSVEVLIEHIDLKAPRLDPKFDIARWGFYPAQDALVRIGAPAIDPILHHLPDEGNALRRHLMCGVLKDKHVEGKEAATNQIKERLAVESNPIKRVNLELSLTEIEK